MIHNWKFAALAAMFALAIPAAKARPVPAQVSIDTGQILGESTGDVTSWKGIPFAAPPTGPLRWRAPQPAAPWAGVRPARDYGHDCMQVPFPGDPAQLATTPSEDCLYANVWRPTAASVRHPLPVIVWIYGGGYVVGGGSPALYSGANLARKGVVFVNFNYRMGRFGIFAHPALTAANADGGLVASYGAMDQIAALKWVRRNIAAFGGDPANVTVIGESAGGISIVTLLTSPLSTGLFDRAVVMSGGDGNPLLPELTGMPEAEKRGAAFAQKHGIAADDPQAAQKLRALSSAEVLDGLDLATMGQQMPIYSPPFADGKVAVDGHTGFASGAFRKVPLMIGATSGDFGGRDGVMLGGARQISRIFADAGAPAYEYRFSYVARSASATSASHGSDVPYFLANAGIRYGDKTTPRDRGISEAITTYLVNFARQGDPNGSGLPHWPGYTRSADELMDFSVAGKPVPEREPAG